MRQFPDEFFRQIIGGDRRGVAATSLRGALALAEPFYAAATRARNWTFDTRLSATRAAPRPVVCVGNITTGGTGKTPVVRWLADALRRRGHRPAVLMRGYKARGGRAGDEQRLLENLLDDPSLPRVPVVANPDRVVGARRAIEVEPDTTVLLLDDGFQHRRLRRDFDLVLIDATNPFGYGRLLPRGLLRESPHGLMRASALLITHAEAVNEADLLQTAQTLRAYNAVAPLYRCRHALGGFVTATDSRAAQDLAGRSYFAFCGIGNPVAFARLLESTGGRCAGTHWFADHHAYHESDVDALERAAIASNADVLVTTEKDWVKLESFAATKRSSLPIWRARLEIAFDAGDDERLLEQVTARLPAPSAASRGAAPASA